MADQCDDLDQLLDSALDDFQSLNLAASAKRYNESRFGVYNVQGLGMGLPDLKIKKKGKQKLAESHVSEALDKLREHTKEAVKGLESMTGGGGTRPPPPLAPEEALVEEWAKQFGEMAGSQDMESIVETMMQQLLSKEILHEPMKEIAERYPIWLEQNKTKLTDVKYAQYCRQYELITDLNKLYESEPDNFAKIVEMMQKMQECGQPPSDIVQELAPDFDLSTLGNLSSDMQESQQNCCMM
ncbi:hypothetical protein M569_00699 [Genlisea aurea]|uniref:Uncharacterized protein n=1 Tax=Genlisea aurea TaxID=192259 RepID=S8EDM5_9LAMI|nr:hypothetical protein M569_00699 [Genlisea aurea]